MLALQEVHAYYGDSHILKGINLEVADAQVVSLLGRNGVGKTTTLRTVMGLVRSRQGQIIFREKEITAMPPHRIASMGVGYVPEERAIFPSLTVFENLTLPAERNKPGFWDLKKIYTHFPILEIRKHNMGSQLSGGEQQMLAIARVLMLNLKLLLLDEPTEGLAPLLVQDIAQLIRRLSKEGVTILIVEQNTRFATQVADTCHVIYNGKIVYTASASHFGQDEDVLKKYLGV